MFKNICQLIEEKLKDLASKSYLIKHGYQRAFKKFLLKHVLPFFIVLHHGEIVWVFLSHSLGLDHERVALSYKEFLIFRNIF